MQTTLVAIVPSAGALFLFWIALRAILQADRRERLAQARIEAAQDAGDAARAAASAEGRADGRTDGPAEPAGAPGESSTPDSTAVEWTGDSAEAGR